VGGRDQECCGAIHAAILPELIRQFSDPEFKLVTGR
jgi:hypothetical protein